MSTDSLQFRFMRFLHEMDFESQRKAEKFYKGLIVAVAILSYIAGSILQQFSVCVYSTLATMVFCCIAVVPGQAPWWRRPLPAFKPKTKSD